MSIPDGNDNWVVFANYNTSNQIWSNFKEHNTVLHKILMRKIMARTFLSPVQTLSIVPSFCDVDRWTCSTCILVSCPDTHALPAKECPVAWRKILVTEACLVIMNMRVLIIERHLHAKNAMIIPCCTFCKEAVPSCSQRRSWSISWQQECLATPWYSCLTCWFH